MPRRDYKKLREAVEAESGLKQVDLWIRSSGAPEKNPDYDPTAE